MEPSTSGLETSCRRPSMIQRVALTLRPHRGPVLYLLLLCALSEANARAEEFEQHAAHEHGKVTINVAVEDELLVIELDSPAANVIGFEHAPRTDSDRAAVHAASELLSGHGLFGMTPEALCQFVEAQVKAPRWAPADRNQGQPQHEEHVDYEARFTYRCATPVNLAWFEPWVLDKLRNVIEARVNIATKMGQHSVIVKSGHTRVPLR